MNESLCCKLVFYQQDKSSKLDLWHHSGTTVYTDRLGDEMSY